MLRTTISALAAVAVASALVIPTVSQAETVNSVQVSYADLNLASERGREVLKGRISGAARIVCDTEDSRELALANATRLCRSEAVAGAQPAFDAAVRAARRGTVTIEAAAALTVSAL